MLTAPALTLVFLGVVVGLGTAFVWMFWEMEQADVKAASQRSPRIAFWPHRAQSQAAQYLLPAVIGHQSQFSENLRLLIGYILRWWYLELCRVCIEPSHVWQRICGGGKFVVPRPVADGGSIDCLIQVRFLIGHYIIHHGFSGLRQP